VSLKELQALFGAAMLNKLRQPHGYRISKRPLRQRGCKRKGHRAGSGPVFPAGTKLLKAFYRNYKP
jgi:hypothetical protein